MSKLDKLKQIAKIGVPIAGPIFGGKFGSVLDAVNNTINNPNKPNENALRDLAEVNDAQTQVLTEHEDRLRKIEAKLGLK